MRFSFTFLFVVISTLLFSQGKIEGIILQEKSNPVSYANVYLEGTSYGTISNGNGEFIIENVPRGTYMLLVSSVGYNTGKIEINVISGETTNVDFSVNEAIIELPGIVVKRVTLTGGIGGLADIPGSAYYLSPKELNKFNYNDINRTLRMIPGMNIQEEDGFGLRPNIGMRGTGSERSSKITVMEDGVLTAPAPYAAPAAYYFPTMGRMQAVEVLKGASQVKYGPFTTGGALNLISSQIPGEFSGKLNLMGGSFGSRSIHAGVGASYQNLGFYIETFQANSDGFKELDNKCVTGFDKEDYLAKIKLNTNPDAPIFQALTIKIGRTTEESDETYLGLTDQDFETTPYRRYAGSQQDLMDTEQEQIQFRHVIRPLKFMDITTTAYNNSFKRNWYKLDRVRSSQDSAAIGISSILENPNLYSSEFSIIGGQTSVNDNALLVKNNNRTYNAKGIQTSIGLNFSNHILTHDIEISFRFHKDYMDRFQWVDDYAMDNGIMELTNSGIPGTESNRIESATAFASYIQYKILFNKLTIIPGLRYESIDMKREDYGQNDPQRTGSNLSIRSNSVNVWIPGIGVDYKFSDNLSSFIGVHKGFAPPGSMEDTESEESVNYEAGIRVNQKMFSGQIIGFINDYSNLLGTDLAAAGGAGSNDQFNGGEVDVKGLELQFQYHLVNDRLSKFRLPLTISYTYTDAQFKNSFDSNYEAWGNVKEGDKLPYISPNQLAVQLSLEHKRFGVNLISKYVSRMRTEAGQGDISVTSSTDDAFIADMSAYYQLNKYLRFFGSIQNLSNNVYSVARRPAGLRPGLPRAFQLGIKTSF